MLDDRRSNSDGFELPAPTDEGEVDAGSTFNGGLTLDDGAGGVAGAPAPPLGCSNFSKNNFSENGRRMESNRTEFVEISLKSTDLQ
jgi:hypothetical protein